MDSLNQSDIVSDFDAKDHSSIDIICLSLSRSDSFVASTGLFLAKEFAKKNRVFLIDHPYSWKDFMGSAMDHKPASYKRALAFGKNLFSKHHGFSGDLTVITTPLTLPINFLPRGFVYNSLLTVNDMIVTRAIKKCIKKYGIKDFIFINFSDPFFLNDLPKKLKPVKSIYYCLDNFSEVPYSQKHGLFMEDYCIANFDYTLCTSSELVKLKSAISSKVFYLPNAADNELFGKASREKLRKPVELQSINTPIIGYTGSIEFRMDFELLKKIASRNPDKTIVLVGPIQTKEHIRLGLDKLSNIVFTGPKKISEIPNYLQYFDCTIIPFLKCITTKSVYPLKINEHLSAGKPIISISFSEDVRSFEKVAYIRDTHDEFLDAIDLALHENSSQKIQERLELALQNSWTARVKKFWNIFENEMAK
ncbi:MAG: glycosyltransferase [Chitinophagaceae bacterium]|nr:glycosyltransferase [Chitinophagaceae bacterium]